MYTRLSDMKYPCTFEEIGEEFPNVAIPPTISEEELRSFGYARVEYIPAPTIDPDTQTVKEGPPVEEGGVYKKGWVVEPLPLLEIEKIAAAKKNQERTIVVNAVQTLLDTTAQGHGYDSALSCISYVGDNNPKFNSEGVAFKAWRSAVWIHCYEIDALDGPRPTLDKFLEGIPKMVWPS